MNTENNNQNIESKKLEITSDNILHCLMHAATREDIGELRAETKANIGDLKLELKADMAELRKELKSDISKLTDKLDTKASKTDMVELRAELKAEMQALRKDTNKYFRWLVGLMFGSFGGIALMILKFPMLTH